MSGCYDAVLLNEFTNFIWVTMHYEINQDIDHVYVLTVKTFTDRIAHVEKEMAKHAIPYTFFYEHLIPHLEKDLETKFTPNMIRRSYKANVLQHIALWEDAIKNGYQRILVFEDDVILNKNFKRYFERIMRDVKNLKEDYVVFLGGADTKVPDGFFLEKGELYSLPIATSEGLIMDIEGIKRRLAWTKVNKIHCPIDHLIAYIDQEQKAQSYWSRVPLTEQASINGDLKSKIDDHRLKHSLYIVKLRYNWNKFHRRQARPFIVKPKYFFWGVLKKLGLAH